MKYDKPSKTIDEQVKLLRRRGLNIEDEEKLKRYLKNINYYHFSIYFKHFQKKDTFIKGVSFENVLNVYVFDQKLRLIVLDVLERIEKSFKCRMVYELAIMSKDPFWIFNEKYFKNKFCYEKNNKEIKESLKKSKEICIKHYYQNYDYPEHPPVWMVVEILTFGQCVSIYGQLKPEYQKIVAETYGINKKFIQNWFFALSVIRNICAHHSRLWNREIGVTLNRRHGLYGKFFCKNRENRLFNYLLVMQIFNCQLNPTSKWIGRLKQIIKKHNIQVSHMGFPEDWSKIFTQVKRTVVTINN